MFSCGKNKLIPREQLHLCQNNFRRKFIKLYKASVRACFGGIDYIMSFLFILFIFLKILFIFGERGREGGREGEKHQCVVASHVASTGDLAYNPGMCSDW